MCKYVDVQMPNDQVNHTNHVNQGSDKIISKIKVILQ